MSSRLNNGEGSPYLITKFSNLIGGLVTLNLLPIHNYIPNKKRNNLSTIINLLTMHSTAALDQDLKDFGGEVFW